MNIPLPLVSEPIITDELRANWNKIYAGPAPYTPILSDPLSRHQRDNLLVLHATLQDALTWLDDTPAFDDYRRKVIACLRSTEKVLGMEQSRPERKR